MDSSTIKNKKIEEFKNYIKNKKVAVLGMGISNIPLISYLAQMGVDITAFDIAEEHQLEHVIAKFSNYKFIRYSLGKNYLDNLKGFDIIFKTPKVRFDIPELQRERERGAVVTSEMELFVDLCPAEIIGITGSDGKTTTTTIVYNILKEEGYKCWLGGNIGTPLIDKVEEISEGDKVVLELSSFQLHTMKKSPNVSIITNITPNHLDVHKSMEEYVDAKKNIFRHQNNNDIVVLNHDNEITRKMAREARGKVRFFSRLNEVEEGTYIRDGVIYFREKGEEREIIKTDRILLPGLHNMENYLAAIAAVAHLVNSSSIDKVAYGFAGVEHRIEFVREINGIKFYNDSIGTSPTRTIASINAFKQKVILIAGGYDKKISYDIMGKVIAEKVKALVLLGQTAPLIEKALLDEIYISGKGADIPIIKCSSLEEAVMEAFNQAVEGDIILLSPASASFDMFKNFEERGNKFKEFVHKIRV